MICRCWF